MRDSDSKLAVPDPERASLVRELFERYATGQESDRSLADWLNATGARTARNRQFGKDTVREMLCNTAYAGYVSGLRDKTRSPPDAPKNTAEKRVTKAGATGVKPSFGTA